MRSTCMKYHADDTAAEERQKTELQKKADMAELEQMEKPSSPALKHLSQSVSVWQRSANANFTNCVVSAALVNIAKLSSI